jgi:hypothetical protein
MTTEGRRMDAMKEIGAAITGIVRSMMDRMMDKVLKEDPFIPEQHHAKKPIYAALVPDEIFKGSHFERRFTTPFGAVWERLAVAVAAVEHGNCNQGKAIAGNIKQGRLKRIQEVLNNLEHRANGNDIARPDWDKELAYILSGGGQPIPATVVCDIYIDSKKTGKKYSFELKAPLPNSDQTKVSKEKMFKLLAMQPCHVDEAYYALPYNPYGKRENYTWSFPSRWFDMVKDASVLIGGEFWDFIGGKGTYEIFISEINSLGEEYRERIYREYLGIEPQKGQHPQRLS